MTTWESKLWEDVEEGEALPTLRMPITLKTMVAAVCGTRDFMPYHHNSEFTKGLGIRDQFVNTMFDQALFGRFTTDWSGPDSDFRKTTLSMVAQICPGDMAIVEGEVTKKERKGDDYLVEVSMAARADGVGIAAHSTATIAMPSREGGPVQLRTSLDKPEVEQDPRMPDFAKAWLGQETPRSAGAYPVSEAQIMYWADMVQDHNPLYEDTGYARDSRHGGLVAPPMSLITWGMGRPGHTGVDPNAPDVENPDGTPWPPRDTSSDEGRPRFDPPGATDTIATISVQEYGTLLRPGDRVSQTAEVVNCSPLKKTKIGLGYYLTMLNTYYNQSDEIVGTNLFTLLRYGVPEDQAGDAV